MLYVCTGPQLCTDAVCKGSQLCTDFVCAQGPSSSLMLCVCIGSQLHPNVVCVLRVLFRTDALFVHRVPVPH